MKLASSQPRPQINPECTRTLGAQLREARELRKLSTQDVADKLLFSKNQVIGLEAGELKYFYGTKLYAQAADKYAAFMELPQCPSAILFDFGCPEDTAIEAIAEAPAAAQKSSAPDTTVEPVVVEAAIAEATAPQFKTVTQTPATRMLARKPKRSALFWGVAAPAIVAGVFYQKLTDTDAAKPAPVQAAEAEAKPIPTPAETAAPASTTPIAPTQAAETALAPTTATPAKVVVVEKSEPASKPVESAQNNAVPDGTIQLSFKGSSWVQSVDQSGSKQEKTYQSGDTLTLHPGKLQALIIGNASAVTVSSSKNPINLGTYVAQGSQVARLLGPQVRQLAQ